MNKITIFIGWILSHLLLYIVHINFLTIFSSSIVVAISVLILTSLHYKMALFFVNYYRK
jgi:hypothetical protein